MLYGTFHVRKHKHLNWNTHKHLIMMINHKIWKYAEKENTVSWFTMCKHSVPIVPLNDRLALKFWSRCGCGENDFFWRFTYTSSYQLSSAILKSMWMVWREIKSAKMEITLVGVWVFSAFVCTSIHDIRFWSQFWWRNPG